MKSLFLLSIFFLLHICFCQDTIVQTNHHDYGFTQTYVLNENGEFSYESRCLCTGITSCGSGPYKKQLNKIVFVFNTDKSKTSNKKCHEVTTDKFHRLKKRKEIYFRTFRYEISKDDLEELQLNRKMKPDEYQFVIKTNTKNSSRYTTLKQPSFSLYQENFWLNLS